jgi:hypothetical protein
MQPNSCHLSRVASCIESLATPNDFTDEKTLGPKEQVKAMNFIVKMMNQLGRSPIDEIELLLILFALYKTSDVVQVKWHRTEKGQAAKATYKEAKEAFLRNGVIDEA